MAQPVFFAQGERILVVEDESVVALDLTGRLEGMGYVVCGHESTGEGAIQAAREQAPDLVVMDIHLKGDMDGVEAAQVIVRERGCPVVFLTAYSEDHTVERARKMAPYGYILKPVHDRELDVTLRMALSKARADREVRDAKRWFEALVAALPDGVIATDRLGRVQLMNPAAERLTGWEGAEASGQAVDEVAHSAPVEGPAERRPLQDSNLLSRSGAMTPVNIKVQPIPGDDGKVAGFVYLVRDVSDRIHYEDTLRAATTAAEAASRAKSEFFAMMAHEFRTPMTGVLGVADLLELSGLSPKQREFLEVIKTSAEGLLSILNDVLDLARIDAGRMSLLLSPMDPQGSLEKAAAAYAPRAQRKGLEFRYVPGPDLPRRVLGDERRLRQVVSNLLDNALKFTEAGSVELRLFSRGHGGDVVTLRVEVEDTGIGIPEEGLKVIFDRFEQLDRSSVRRYPGTGLGLAVCHELVQLMGGEISVESTPGQGSTFQVTIPFRMG